MTTFERAKDGSSDYFTIDTMIATGTIRALEAIRDLEQLSSRSDALNKVVHVHHYYDALRSRGEVLLAAYPNNLVSLAPPALAPVSDTEVIVPARFNVVSTLREYLQGRTSAENPEDLVPFWQSAVVFYGTVSQHHLQDAAFYALSPDFRLNPLRFDDPFGSEGPN